VPYTKPHSGCAAKAASPVSIACGRSRSSLSRKTTKSPVRARSAVLRATAAPWFGCSITVTPAHERATAAESSREPSSTTTTSAGGCDCAKAVAMVSRR
jgi:hypothetical protein